MYESYVSLSSLVHDAKLRRKLAPAKFRRTFLSHLLRQRRTIVLCKNRRFSFIFQALRRIFADFTFLMWLFPKVFVSLHII